MSFFFLLRFQSPGEWLVQQKRQELNDVVNLKDFLTEKSQTFKGKPNRVTLVRVIFSSVFIFLLFDIVLGFFFVQACHLLSELIDDVTVDLCFDVHRRAKLEPQAFVATRALPDGSDIYGQSPDVNNIQFDCPHCKRLIGGAKFATHLEKCMGLARNSRTTTKKTLQSEAGKEGGEKSEIFDLLGDFEDDDDTNDTTYAMSADKKSGLLKSSISLFCVSG